MIFLIITIPDKQAAYLTCFPNQELYIHNSQPTKSSEKVKANFKIKNLFLSSQTQQEIQRVPEEKVTFSLILSISRVWTIKLRGLLMKNMKKNILRSGGIIVQLEQLTWRKKDHIWVRRGQRLLLWVKEG